MARITIAGHPPRRLLDETEFIPAGSDPLKFTDDVRNPRGRTQLARLRALYAQRCPARAPELDRDLIPRTLHRVWLGGPPPAEVVRFGETWRRHHPDWDFVLWDEAKVRAEGFGTADLIAQASCFGQKVDVLRVEILNRYGGVYVDTDFECFRPIDTLLRRYEFFASSAFILQAHLGWPSVWPSPLIVNNAFIGARANHPILTAYLDRIRRDWKPAAAYRVAPGELSAIAILAMGGRAKADHVKELGLRTYLPFHDVTAELAGADDRRDVVLPHTYFHPTLGGGRAPLFAMPQFWWRALNAPLGLFATDRYDRVWPESYANHVSKRTWLKRPMI